MPHDIDIIKERVRTAVPDVRIEQLKVSHPGTDDDGLWSFHREAKKEKVSLESSTYDAPFTVEFTSSDRRFTARTVEEAIDAVRTFLIV